MNYTTAVFLINPKVRAVACIYEPDTEKVKVRRTVFKTLDQELAVDDFAIVPTDTRHHMTVVKVVEVDLDPDIETDEDVEWIISRVDRREYERTKTEEGRAIKMMKDAEKTHQRGQLREKLLAHVDQTQLGALSIAQLNAPDQS